MLEYFVIKFDAFATDTFCRDLKSAGRPGVILIWGYDGAIRVVQNDSGSPLREQYKFFETGSIFQNRWLKWPRLILMMTGLIYRVHLRTRSKILFIGGGDVLVLFSIPLYLLARVGRIVLTVEDWSRPAKTDSIYDRLNKIKIIFNDWFFNHLDVTVVVFNKEIFDVRNAYWKNRTLKNSVLSEHMWAWFLENKHLASGSSRPKQILFFGSVRPNLCLDQIFELLPELNAEYGFTLKVISLESEEYKRYRKKSEDQGLVHLIEWRGFVEAEGLATEMSSCFCGLNIQASEMNNSVLAIAGRVVDFLQYRVVPILSPYSGAILSYIQKHQLGIVCKPESDSIRAAIVEAYTHYQEFGDRIESFVKSSPYKRKAIELIAPEHPKP